MDKTQPPSLSVESPLLIILTEMYRIPPGNSSTKGNEMGIFEGIGDVYAQEDFDLFFSTLAMYAASPHQCGVR